MAKAQKDAQADQSEENPKPKPHPNLPVVEVKEADTKEISNPPKDEDFNKGQYKHRETGEVFALAIHEPDDYFRTHSLKNTAHFIQCTEEEFRLKFDKA